MARLIVIAFVVGGLIVAWTAGHAQAKVADFQLAARVADGKLTLICARGCDWNADWNATNPSPKPAPNTVVVECAANGSCTATVTGYGLVNGLQIR